MIDKIKARGASIIVFNEKILLLSDHVKVRCQESFFIVMELNSVIDYISP